MPDEHARKNLLTELESGDPVEHYRSLHADPAWKKALVVPQSVPRVYRGFHGDLRTVQPLLGTEVFSNAVFGTAKVAYVPLRYRIDIIPKMRKQNRADAWNIYAENAAYFSIPTLKGRRPEMGTWCILLTYAFETEEHRSRFWVNPLDDGWDLEQGEVAHGRTFYCDHRPLPVTCAFARIDRMAGTMRHRGKDAMDALRSLLLDCTPKGEWVPPPRCEKPAPAKRYKLPESLRKSFRQTGNTA